MNRNHREFIPTSATSQLNHASTATSTMLAIKLLVLCGLMSGRLLAQTTTPGTYADANSPSGAPDPLKLDSIWQVDNISGSLSVKIPFGTVPMGGRGPKIPFSLIYNSSATVTLQSRGLVNNGQQEDFQWAPGNITSTSSSSPIGPWAMSGPSISGAYTQIPDYQPIYGNGIYGQMQYGCTILGPYLYIDENGATHDLNVASGGSSSQNAASACSNAYNDQVLQGATVDGSNLQTTAGTALYPNGTAYLGAGTLEDANGNIASRAQDSEGRTPFSTTMHYNSYGSASTGNTPYELALGTFAVTTTGATGNTESYSVTVAPITIGGYTMPHPIGVWSDFCCLGTTQGGINIQPAMLPMDPTLTVNAVTSIGLPDGNAYTFTYDPTYGTISKITFPTGGYVRFTYGTRSDSGGYGNFEHKSSIVVKNAYVSTGSGSESQWSYTFNSMTTRGVLTSTVTAPDGSYTNYTGWSFVYSTLDLSFGSAPSFREVLKSVYNSGDALVESVATTYGAPTVQLGINFISGLPGYSAYPPYPSQVATTIYDGSSPIQSQVVFIYDKYNNIIEKDESDFYPCSPNPCAPSATPSTGWLRKTFTNYLWSNPNPGQPTFGRTYTQAYIVNKPSQVTVTDGSGNLYSLTQYNYDEFPLSGSAGILNHDDTNFPASTVGARGNLTTEKHCAAISGSSCSTWISKTTKYDLTGMPVTMSDYNGNLTTYDYTDAYVSGAPSSQTNAYPTTVTSVASPFIDTYTYNYYTGSIATHTDPNSKTITFEYADLLNRITSTTYPATTDGSTAGTGSGGVSYTYTDNPGNWTVVKNLVQSLSISPITTTIIYDGLGRSSYTQLNSDPAGVGTLYLSYDGLGRVASKTNPYYSSNDSTYGTTSFTYDALGRMRFQCQPDNGTTGACVAGASYLEWAYNGNVTTSYDEIRNSWQRTSDGLGRLTQVVEPGSLMTLNVYDPLGNLSCIEQHGGISGTGCASASSNDATSAWHVRRFSYDPLSRLLTSKNPETGTTCYGATGGLAPTTANCPTGYGMTGYGYDANGNLVAKTDGRGVETDYRFDAHSRLLWKAHQFDLGATPSSCFQYDGSGIRNGIGRLAVQWTQQGSCPSSPSAGLLTQASVAAYDAMGRLLSESTAAPNTSGAVDVTYDLAGNRTSITYPDGRKIQNGFDSAGRMNAVNYQAWNGNAMNQSYFSETNGYDPAGHLVSASFGNGVPYGAGYDNRERMKTLQYGAAAAPLWSKQYAWTTNSNMQSQADLITGIQRQFGYDSLNRLTAAQDIFSNLAVASGSNAGTTSTTTSGSGAAETPGASGAVPMWTNPDDSNALATEIGAPNSSWTIGSVVLALSQPNAPDGTSSAIIVTSSAGSTDAFVSGPVSSPASYSGEAMTGSVWLRSVSGAQAVNLYLVAAAAGVPGNIVAARSATLSAAWQQVQLTGTAPNNTTGLALQIGGGGTVSNGQSFEMWNPMVEDEGTLGSSVTNFLPYSQQPSAATWGAWGVSLSRSSDAAPDGTQTVFTVTGTGNAGSYVTDSVSNPAPFNQATVTGSVFVRAASGTAAMTVYVVEATGGNVPVCGQRSATLTTAWQRIAVTCTAQNALSRLYLQVSGATGQSFDIWGAQLELASQAGPYVPTGAVPVTSTTTLTNLFQNSMSPPAGVASSPVGAPDGSITASQVPANSANSSFGYSVVNPELYDDATITASVYLRVPSGSQTTNLYLNYSNASGIYYLTPQTVTLTSAWQRFPITGTVGSGLTNLSFQIGGANSFSTGQTIDVWGPQIQLGTVNGPYIATDGLPIIVGSQPSNVMPNSQTLNGPSWYYDGSLSAPNATAPDGSATAATFVSPANAADGYMAGFVPNPSLYDGQQVTASVYLRTLPGVASQSVQLFVIDFGSQYSGGSIASTKTAALTSTWQRFALTATLENGLSQLYLQLGGGGTVHNGQGFEIWGPQFVVGGDPGAYTPTASATTVYATGAAGTLVPTGLNESYSYDSFGNMLSNGSFQASYDNNNRMFGYAYDQAGNLLSDRVANIMTWDAESRISSVAGTNYIYDAEGNRVEKQGATVEDTVYFGGQPIARYQAGQWTDLVYGPTGLLAEVPGTQTAPPVYRLTDNLGTNVGSLLADGSFVDPIDHTPFGRVFTGNTNDPYLFTGKERDAESGLDYFGARYMGSSMGRFMSPDWSDDPVAIPYSDLSNPQTLNLYAYAGNNPVSNVDDDGHNVTLCATGSTQCTTISDDQWKSIQQQIASGNSGGVTVDGKGFLGTGTIQCGGSACGTATYSEQGLQDASGPMLMGIAGGMAVEYAVGRAIGAVAGWLGRGAGEAASSAAGNAAVDVTNLSAKIVKQMGTRGWTKEEIAQTVQNGTAHAVTNKATGGAATEFVSPATGKFVVVDNATKQVLQVSGPGFSPNHLMNP